MPIGFNPSQYQLASFKGVLVGKPVPLCTTQNQQSKVLPCLIDWITYPTFAVSINLNQGTTNPLNKIVGCYADNTNNSSDIIITFPDTGYTILVPVGVAKFFPVASQTLIANIYNGARANTINAGQQIYVMFTNFLVDNFDATALALVTSLVLGTSTGTLGNYSLTYVTPVVGDNHVDIINNLTSTTAVGSFLPVQSVGNYIVTNYHVAIAGAYNSGGATVGSLGIYDTTAAIPKTTHPIFMTTNLEFYPYKIIYEQSSEYMLFDATHTLNTYNNFVCSAGVYHISFDFLWTVSR